LHCNFLARLILIQFEVIKVAKGSSINGNADGENGSNKSYSVKGRGNVSRPIMVKEVKQGKHPDTHVLKVNGVEYARNNPNHNKPDNIDD
jgi:hypothetical protein